ncbi:DUF397 domain-containing protein [Embleya sp. AB8]|uniref:DUF397 domain-containing protein n=1 Tax=Embleya sp. AB8 TaxID=3156304 RepID=UPI003C7272F1
MITPHPDYPQANWRKSKHSGTGGDCVEVAALASTLIARDSKAPAAQVLTFPPDVWGTFTTRIRTGDWARPA